MSGMHMLYGGVWFEVACPHAGMSNLAPNLKQ